MVMIAPWCLLDGAGLPKILDRSQNLASFQVSPKNVTVLKTVPPKTSNWFPMGSQTVPNNSRAGGLATVDSCCQLLPFHAQVASWSTPLVPPPKATTARKAGSYAAEAK